MCEESTHLAGFDFPHPSLICLFLFHAPRPGHDLRQPIGQPNKAQDGHAGGQVGRGGRCVHPVLHSPPLPRQAVVVLTKNSLSLCKRPVETHNECTCLLVVLLPFYYFHTTQQGR